MEASGSGIDWKTRSNVCRCCLAPGCYKDLSTLYFHSGQREVYAEMLKDTFNIEFTYQDGCGPSTGSRLICDTCIIRLRDATAFKLQALSSEANIVQHLATLKTEFLKEPETTSAVNASMNVEVKSEPVVEASWESDVQISFDGDLSIEGYGSFDDDEILANVKFELIKEKGDEIFEEPLTEGRRKSLRSNKKAFKQTEQNNDNEKQQKDWSKIAERRGNGPILRENSLKLISNSSMCVFQWNKSRYRCFCCEEPFSDMASLRNHTNTHTLKQIEKKIITQQNRLVKVETTDLVCKICSKTIKDIVELRQHLSSIHDVKFIFEEDLLVPFKLGSNELHCQICREIFTVFRLLNIHMNKHFQKQVCHICGAGFSNLVFLNLHKTRSHRPLKCNQCNIEFTNRSEKRQHERTEHGVKIERKLRFPCPFCNERFFQENFKVKHLVEKHGMVKPDHRCNLCSKSFLTKSLRNNHVKNVHLKEKKRECDICHMRFYTKSDVSRHRVTHTGEKNYECNLCNNMFATRDSLRRHLKRTHGSSS